jgi:hypothetical protein
MLLTRGDTTDPRTAIFARFFPIDGHRKLVFPKSLCFFFPVSPVKARLNSDRHKKCSEILTRSCGPLSSLDTGNTFARRFP